MQMFSLYSMYSLYMRTLLSTFTYACLVINAKNQIITSFGGQEIEKALTSCARNNAFELRS